MLQQGATTGHTCLEAHSVDETDTHGLYEIVEADQKEVGRKGEPLDP